MTRHTFKFIEEKNEMHDHILDIMAVGFKFDHQKGLAEWIKNSADAYIRAGFSQSQQAIILRFTDSDENRSIIECIDFVGMTRDEIVNAFKIWGDPEASKRGTGGHTYGGHGNGGKFYMRQMFAESYFITYKNNKLNVYGFSPNKKYGFASEDGIVYENINMTLEEAMRYAGIDKINNLVDLSQNGLSIKGFTVLRGISPTGMPNSLPVQRILEKLRNHPQAIRIASSTSLYGIHNNKFLGTIKPDSLKPLAGFEKDFEFIIPHELSYSDHNEKKIIFMDNKNSPQGKLILKTSDEALEKNSKYGDLNRIDILGKIGSLASYYIYELGQMYPQAVFIYGKCTCPILEDPSLENIVTNERTKLGEDPRTKALLQWIAEKINALAEKIVESEKKEAEKIDNKRSAEFNNFLNRWANRFFNKLRAEVLMGPGEGPGSGRGMGGNGGGVNINDGDGSGKKTSTNGPGDKDGGGNTPKRRPRFPRILLSEIDPDPLDRENRIVHLDPRHPVIYQRTVPNDAVEGIYWINTSSPLARAILFKHGSESQQWRSYLFQRYVDIFIKERIREMYKQNSENFTPEAIDAEVFGKFLVKVHEEAKEIQEFLLEIHYAEKTDERNV